MPDMPIGNIESAGDCQLKCQELENCMYWTLDNEKCWLQHKKGNIFSKPGVQAGPKFCGKL